MGNQYNWWAVFAVVILAPVSAPALAEQYLTVEQAQKALFPEAGQFVSQPVRLSPEQKSLVEKYARVRMRAAQQPVWRVEIDGKLVGWFVVDEVYGKHEFITYAVALDANGAVKGLEILDYRETHGAEIRNKRWQAQFTDKRYGSGLKLGKDIDNISGATLSCKHITEGVRRVLALYETALK
jgi:Na+-translocating ferredoxin:NAD+ oxidoreductase RnfG subunit